MLAVRHFFSRLKHEKQKHHMELLCIYSLNYVFNIEEKPCIPVEISVLIPPKNCLTNEFALSKENIEPHIKNLESILFGLKSIENRITKTKAINICTNNNVIKHFNQALKKEEVA